MRPLVVALILLVGCDLHPGGPGGDDGGDDCGGCDAGWSTCNGSLGGSCTGNATCTYPRPDARPMVCACDGYAWRCSDCPADFREEDATCTPGESCVEQDWEHGCDCTCTADGKWACIPETIGSTCPTGGIDASLR